MVENIEAWTTTCHNCKEIFSAFVPAKGFSVTPCPNCQSQFLATRWPRPMGFSQLDLSVVSQILQGSTFTEAVELFGVQEDTGYCWGAKGRLMEDGSDTHIDSDVIRALGQLSARI